MAILVTTFLAFIPGQFYAWAIYRMDRYEKEPRTLLGGAFIWGAVVAAGGAFILNTLFGVAVYSFTADPLITDIATGSISAPFVEETLKGLAVLIVFLFFRKEFDSVLDGIVYATVTALGFAATENVLYMMQYGYNESGWEGIWAMFFIRVVLGAWNHPAYTAFTGIGLAIARLNRSRLIKLIAPVAGFTLSVFAHVLHNTVSVFANGEGGLTMLLLVDWSGWLFILGIMAWAISRERMWISFQLQQEVQNGLITPGHYQVAVSPFKRELASLNGLTNGKYFSTRKFYQLCAELAYKKQQIARLGSSGGNTTEMVNQLRAEIVQLAPKANT